MGEEVELKKPPWLRVRVAQSEQYASVQDIMVRENLHTVCQEALCPNMGECWGSGTATFLILGDMCTRGCGFCSVRAGNPKGIVQPDEPLRVARAAQKMSLRYVVVTSVTRDDLADGGAGIFAETVRELKRSTPSPLVELLIPDMEGRPLETVLGASPDVLAHNVETVERISRDVRHRESDYRRSLRVLRQAHEKDPRLATKSSLMLGLGETTGELDQTMDDLLDVGVQILVLGQYLRPSKGQVPVQEYVHPDRFEALAQKARDKGFGFVVAGPLVRTSYHAAEAHAGMVNRDG